MPEGPELHLASRYVNRMCGGRVFTGHVVKSAVHKSDDVPFEAKAYTISAASRGKEMQLILSEIEENSPTSNSKRRNKKTASKNGLPKLKSMKILFRFGMSGRFEFTKVSDVHKHSHLQFFTADDDLPMVLSHVDVRRFGRWEVDADWSENRGPDPMFEYQRFRSNVVKNVNSAAFQRPICETLLNQKYFNGIGNYLRAEILYRVGTPPFAKAYDVLKGLSEDPPDVKPKVKGHDTKVKVEDSSADILHLCHTVPLEVIDLGGGGYNPDGESSDYSKFNAWLRCYYQPGMRNMVDHNKRTIWFQGDAGPMAPKEGKSRSPVKRRKKAADTSMKEEESSPAKKVKAKGKTASLPKNGKKIQPNNTEQVKLEDVTASEKPPKRTTDRNQNRGKKAVTKTEGSPRGHRYATRSNVSRNGMDSKTQQKKR